MRRREVSELFKVFLFWVVLLGYEVGVVGCWFLFLLVVLRDIRLFFGRFVEGYKI